MISRLFLLIYDLECVVQRIIGNPEVSSNLDPHEAFLPHNIPVTESKKYRLRCKKNVCVGNSLSYFLVTQYAIEGKSTNLYGILLVLCFVSGVCISYHLDHIYIANHIPLNSPDLDTFQLDESSKFSTKAI